MAPVTPPNISIRNRACPAQIASPDELVPEAGSRSTQEKKKKELEELEATLAEFGIEGGGGSGGAKPSTVVRVGRLAYP